MARLILIHVAGLGMFAAGYFGRLEYEYYNYWTAPPAGPQRRSAPTASERPGSAESSVHFEDVARRLNVDHFYYDGAAGDFHLIETLGGGAAIFDYDNDGRVDLFLVNGCQIPADPGDRAHTGRLFANRGAVGFADVTAAAGAEIVMYGHGATAADYDNDGFDDLCLSGFRRLVLLRNHGDGTFGVARAAGVATDRTTTSTALADLDQDGDLDLYVCTYCVVPLEDPLFCERSGRRMHCEPARYPSQPDLLFANQGDGRFRDVTKESGIRDEHGRGLGVAIADFDGDHRADIFVANDGSPNFLFHNQGGLRFVDVAVAVGVALNGEGSTMSSMGVACADYDQNGRLDLFVTDFYERTNVLFRNLGRSGFVDAAEAAGVGASSRELLGWGTLFVDADLDSRADLFVANGHVSDMSPFGIPYKMRQQFYRNAGDTFREESLGCGEYFHRKLRGRGTARGDLNNDGRPDIVVSHIRDETAVLLNRSVPHGRWIGLELVGRRSNRGGVNTKVWLTAGALQLYHEQAAGAAYLSSSDSRVLLGLGGGQRGVGATERSAATGRAGAAVEGMAPVTSVDVRLRWPSGIVQVLRGLGTDRYHVVVEPR